MFRMYKAAAVLSVLMKVCTIPCHVRGHINILLVLQSCRDSLRVLPSSSSETIPTSSDGTYDGNMKVQEDVDVIEECFIAINKEVDIGIKQEEMPEDITFPDIKAELDDVSCVCVYMSVIRLLLLVSRNVSCFYGSIFCQLKHLPFWDCKRFAVLLWAVGVVVGYMEGSVPDWFVLCF